MARPRNPEESVEVTIRVTPRIAQWLDELALIGNFGNQRAAVAQHFVLAAVTNELRNDGLLRNPPPQPRGGTAGGNEGSGG